jgi:hypothetical protein
MMRKGLGRLTLTLALLLGASTGAGIPAEEAGGDLSLRETLGRVVDTPVTPDAEGIEWQEVVVRSGDAAPLRLRLGPKDYLARARFTVKVGDEVRVRFFSAGAPPSVQRIRNQTTGQVLRLRCLHGEAFWNSGGHPGPGGHHHGGEGGSGPGGRGGPGGHRGP